MFESGVIALPNNILNEAIREMAEQLRSYLRVTGDITIVSLRRKFSIPECLFNQAIGWLACEGRIELRKQGRYMKVHPTE